MKFAKKEIRNMCVAILVMIYFLIDSKMSPSRMTLLLFDLDNEEWKKILDKEYRLYFFIPYPHNEVEMENIEERATLPPIIF